MVVSEISKDTHSTRSFTGSACRIKQLSCLSHLVLQSGKLPQPHLTLHRPVYMIYTLSSHAGCHNFTKVAKLDRQTDTDYWQPVCLTLLLFGFLSCFTLCLRHRSSLGDGSKRSKLCLQRQKRDQPLMTARNSNPLDEIMPNMLILR